MTTPMITVTPVTTASAITVTVTAAVIVVGGGSTDPPIYLSYNPSNIYDLTRIPTNPASTKVFINGVKQVYGIDYTIANTLMTWVSSSPSLSVNDIIEVYL